MSSAILNKRQQMVAENHFYGKTATLNLFQQVPKMDDKTAQKTAVFRYLQDAWNEIKDTKEGKELFFVLVFSIGDVQNREHNLFRKKGMKDVEGGGNSKRRIFLYCLEWMLSVIPNQFYNFLPIIGEYYNLDGIMMYELRTDRFKGNLIEILKLNINLEVVTKYIAGVLKSNRTTPNERKLWAKWLPHIPGNKRVRNYEVTEKNIKAFNKGGEKDVVVGSVVRVKKDKKDHTKTKDAWTFKFISLLSKEMDWEVIKHENNIEFKGYKAFKKAFLSETEAAMFSSQRIRLLDKPQLFEWFNQLPSDARFRVAKRLLNKDKSSKALTAATKWTTQSGINIGTIYLEWLASKEQAQQAIRDLTPEKIEQLKKEDPNLLQQMKKSAKVNTGATNLLDLFANIYDLKRSEAEINTIAHTLLEKIKVSVPTLLVADVSGSMGTGPITHNGVEFTPNKLVTLAATIFLLKNPDPTAEPMFVRFGSHAEMVVQGNKVTTKASRFMNTSVITVDKLIDPKASFTDNLESVQRYNSATEGATHLTCIAAEFKRWVDSEPAFRDQRIEQINQYQVLLVMSDGDINGYGNPAQSVLVFQREMLQYFGWAGVIVLWDVKKSQHDDGKKFDGLTNIMYFGGTDYNKVDQIFTKIHDLDVIDSFLPLKTLHMSNRYLPVKSLVIE